MSEYTITDPLDDLKKLLDALKVAEEKDFLLLNKEGQRYLIAILEAFNKRTDIFAMAYDSTGKKMRSVVILGGDHEAVAAVHKLKTDLDEALKTQAKLLDARTAERRKDEVAGVLHDKWLAEQELVVMRQRAEKAEEDLRAAARSELAGADTPSPITTQDVHDANI